MPELQWRSFVGQERIKEVLGSAFENETLGHAYLLCGEVGTGTFAAAVELAMALLCGSEGARPCYSCQSCQKVQHYAHPDLHVIMPVPLQKEHKASDGKLSEEGWKFLSGCVEKRIANPYYPQNHDDMPTMPVEWIREVNHAIKRGALEGGRNIAILDGVDMMQKEAANAMLKTLEEPPPGTVMVLLTDRLHSVLPTIVSRCQILRFACLYPEIIKAEIAARFNTDNNDPRLEKVAYSGSLGQSIFLWENPLSEVAESAADFWNVCCGKDWLAVATHIDTLSRLDNYGAHEKLFEQIIHLVRNAFFDKIAGTENYIMGDRSLPLELKGVHTPDQAEAYVEFCEKAIGQIRARANISLVLINFAISVMEQLHGKKQ